MKGRRPLVLRRKTETVKLKIEMFTHSYTLKIEKHRPNKVNCITGGPSRLFQQRSLSFLKVEVGPTVLVRMDSRSLPELPYSV